MHAFLVGVDKESGFTCLKDYSIEKSCLLNVIIWTDGREMCFTSCSLKL
jgi:hypothetical protein